MNSQLEAKLLSLGTQKKKVLVSISQPQMGINEHS